MHKGFAKDKRRNVPVNKYHVVCKFGPLLCLQWVDPVMHADFCTYFETTPFTLGKPFGVSRPWISIALNNVVRKPYF